MTVFHCEAAVINCFDARIQKGITDWLQRRFSLAEYDHIALAGGVMDQEAVFKQVGISRRLHAIKKVILINHEDCGAYGEDGTLERHAADLRSAGRRLQGGHPGLEVELYYMHLTGILERLSYPDQMQGSAG